MKKPIISICLSVILAGVLGGCGSGEKESSGAPDQSQGTELSDTSGTAQDASGTDSQELSVSTGGILDPWAVMNLSGKDNSMDAYSASAREALLLEMPENALDGGMKKSVLGATGAYCFKKHLFDTVAESWDEVIFAGTEGKADSKRYDFEDQLWDIGPVAGTDHYVALSVEIQEDGEYRSFLTERDENHEYLREVPLDFLNGSETGEVVGSLSGFAVDQFGAVSLVHGGQYLLMSQEGDILAEYSPEGGSVNRLVILYDGRIAFEVTMKGNGGTALQYMDRDTLETVTLATLEKSALYLTLLDGETLLYAAQDGVYRSGLNGEEPELIYRWINHGIIIHDVAALQADEKGRISLIYSDSENDNYLCLEPTAEEIPVCEITLQVRSGDMDSYQRLAAEFNRRYPSCHIELAEYSREDEAALLTQLTAGEGPVLLDPSGLSFEEMEELWEPLDTVMGQLGITEELNPGVMEMGKINGTLYGLVRDFGLDTVVAEAGLKDWDYDMFFQSIRERTELDEICNYYDKEAGLLSLVALLNHGLDDCYFFVPDEETGALHFDSGKFRQILDLAEKYPAREEGVAPGASLLEGNALCNILIIQKPEHVAAYRIIYGEDVDYVGYPAKDGGMHVMVPSGMLSIRRSASKEEKEAAAAFLALCLSYEGQILAAKDINFALSVRRDVLEAQIASMGTEISRLPNFDPDFGSVNMGGGMDIERDRETLLDLIGSAKPKKTLSWELSGIIREELDLYLAGSITEDMLIDHLENRIGLYLGERN